MAILRDDLIAGGTKRRALTILLNDIPQQHVVYAGTLMGHGALALAHAAKDHGKTAHIFVATDDIDHPMLHKLQAAGALLHLEEPQPIADLYALAERWQNANDAHLFPPGFDAPEFEAALVTALHRLDLSSHSEIWTCAVTGTLTRALQKAFPDKVFKTVKVVKAECDLGKAAIYQAAEKYHQPALQAPPYPSCPFTDAKIWAFAMDKAAPGALIWNTAG